MSQIHNDPTCPCHEFSARTPSEPSTIKKADAGFLVPEAENVSQGQCGAGMTLCRACQGSGAGDGMGGVCPYCHGSGQVETYEARQRRLATVAVPTFEQEWHDAPKWTTRTTEQQVAQWWFIRGQHAKEVELLAGMNGDLREMVRVARERIER